MTDSGLSSKMLELLRCPCPEHGSLTYLAAGSESPAAGSESPEPQGDSPAADMGSPRAEGELVCDECHRAFPVRDGIPVMLLDEARGPGA